MLHAAGGASAQTPRALPADDADLAPGAVNATSYGPIAKGAAIAVRPLDNTAANLRLKAIFGEALAARAHRVGETAPLVLSFETEIRHLGRASRGSTEDEVRGRSLTAPVLTEDAQPQRDESQVRLPFSTDALGGAEAARRAPQPVFALGRLRYVLMATVDDQQTGQRVWQGEASYDGFGADEETVLRALVPVLSEQVGETVRLKGFRLE